MDLSQYLEMFIDETKEHLQNLNDQVLVLESEPDNIDTINEIFRAAHSLRVWQVRWDLRECSV